MDDNTRFWLEYIAEFSLNDTKKEKPHHKSRCENSGENSRDELNGAKLVSGDYVYISKNKLLGYCHCDLHKGYLTKSIYTKHKCAEKQCSFFQKFDNCPYWQAKRIHQEYKKTAVQKKNDKKAREDELRSWAAELQQMADNFGHHIKITSLRQGNNRGHIIAFYISDKPYNDRRRFFDVAKAFGAERSVYIELRHVKDINGKYALL